MPMPGLDAEDIEDPRNLLVEGIISRTEANEAVEKKRKMSKLEKQYHDELQMEVRGIPFTASSSDRNMQSPIEDRETKEEALPDPDQIAKDAERLSQVGMSNKKQKLYKAMKIGQERKRSQVTLLQERKKKAKAGKSA